MSSNASVAESKDLVDLEQNIPSKQRPVHRLLTPLLTKKVPEIPKESERKPYPLYHTNLLSKFFFFWLIPLLNKGYKRTLLQEDLWHLDEKTSIDYVYERFETNLTKRIVNYHLKNPDLENKDEIPRFAIVMAILETFKWEYFIASFARVLGNIAITFSPLVSRDLINFIQKKSLNPDLKVNKGVGYSIGLTLLLIASAILFNQSLQYAKLVGGHSKTILTKALLNKSLIANAETRYKYPSGKIISFMSADLSRIDLALGFSPLVVAFPVPIIIGIVLLIVNLGVSALAGIAIFILTFIVMSTPASAMFKLRIKANKFTDERVSLMREILQSMKMVKFYSWEDAYEKLVTVIRNKEIKYVFKIQLVINIISTIALNSASITSMGAFLVLYAVRSHGNPAAVFSSLSLFNLLAVQVTNIPIILSYCADALSAIDRITKYLQSPEEYDAVENFYDNSIIDPKSKVAVKIENGEFEWPEFEELKEDDTNDVKKTKPKPKKKRSLFNKKLETSNDAQEVKTESEEKELNELPHESIEEPEKKFSGLHDINLKVYQGEFIVVTGSTGSGKSSLLSAIASFMAKKSGLIGVNGSLLLCGQPWVQNSTVKENILFGEQYDSKRYKSVIEVCALESDLKSLPAGDLTEIGERGVTLSGGQKARVNLARAVYSLNKDIYLLDDILSAVDANVGKHITKYCLMEYIGDRTRILATHQLSLIKKADRVVFVNNDGTIDVGTENELREKNPQFVALMEFNKEHESGDHKKNDQIAKVTSVNDEAKPGEENGALFGEEERAYDSIPFSIYKQYAQAGQGIFGFSAFFILLFLMVLAVFLTLFTNVWLSFWVGNKFKSLSNGTYIGLYVGFTILSCVLIALEFTMMGYINTEASKVLNLQAVKRVLHTPMSFMDTTPIGRIINRFSKDTNSLDNEISLQLKLFLHFGAVIIGILILAIIYLPWFAITIPFLLIMFLVITNYYQASSREVKRLEAINRSFVYNNFNEVLNGLNTIKAYGAQNRFMKKNDKFVDRLNEVYFVVIANQRWIAVNLDTLAGLIVFIVAMLSVTRQFNISPSSVGLLTYYMIEFSQLLSFISTSYTEVENEMNSVERVCHYANNLEQEAAYRRSEFKPAPEWPSKGEVCFQNVSSRYREGLPLVLNNLSFVVEESSKIGICGRTGAGKSSLVSTLYRLSELAGGKILIDGVNISQLGLFDLRSKLSIIPQDPVLFQGTIKKNLDPFNEATDDELWDAMRRSGLISTEKFETIKTQTENQDKFHLNSKVEDEGANFSLGERQLLALARALVRRSKILIMDEATSSVDFETDAKIQKTIAEEFKKCTILCIAHRLKTIIKYDKILVLEKGELEEYGEPTELFSKGGIFREMCESSDITADDFK